MAPVELVLFITRGKALSEPKDKDEAKALLVIVVVQVLAVAIVVFVLVSYLLVVPFISHSSSLEIY